MFASITNLALPLLLLSPIALAAPSTHFQNRRNHHNAVRAQTERDVESVNNSTQSLVKRQSYSGQGTFYYVNVGPGACGQWNNNDDYTVALNSAQYGGGYPGPQCFKTITIQANGVTVGGVRIMDECPTCGYGSLDLSPGLFQRFAPESAGVISINWWFEGSSPAPQPSTTTQAPASTSEWHEPSPTPQWTPPPSSAAPSPSPTTPPPPPPPSSSSSSTTPPPPSSTSTRASSAAPSSISTAFSSASSAAASSVSSASSSGVNAFAILSSVAGSSTSGSISASATASASASGAETTHVVSADNNNLEAINNLITNYGQIVVAGAGGQ